MVISFTIPGRVGGKGRPKFARRGKFVTAYSPAKTVSTEAMLRAFAHEAMRGCPLLDGAIHLTVLVSLERPQSWSRRKRTENPVPTGKPDLDNVAKLIGDALNGVVWRDDAQIASLHIARQFVETGERVEVVVHQIVAVVGAAAYATVPARAA